MLNLKCSRETLQNLQKPGKLIHILRIIIIKFGKIWDVSLKLFVKHIPKNWEESNMMSDLARHYQSYQIYSQTYQIKEIVHFYQPHITNMIFNHISIGSHRSMENSKYPQGLRTKKDTCWSIDNKCTVCRILDSPPRK